MVQQVVQIVAAASVDCTVDYIQDSYSKFLLHHLLLGLHCNYRKIGRCYHLLLEMVGHFRCWMDTWGAAKKKKKSQIITNNSQSRFINAFIVGDVFELIIQHHFKLELKLRLIVLKLDKRCLNKTLVSSINIFVVCLCVKMNFELSGRKITLELHFLRRQKNAICHPRLWEIG